MASRWRSRLFPRPDSRELASWLTEPGSLTARCQRACGQFRVRLLAAGSARLLPDEAAVFGLRPGQRAWRREVVLECDGVPVIFAHTVLPRRPGGRLTAWLPRLGSRSLGSLLFSHPGFRRGAIESIALDARHPLHRRARNAIGAIPEVLWARRSQHRLGAQRVLVCEVFLPAILDLNSAAEQAHRGT